ncbi:MAG TPA: ABC transporter permease [Candidatus Acidoferrales bacterium]|jgi:simple sugar transport system permease protein|nr:ABC transporter permease [Candidatus Acidoferrales bacterium]
MSGPPLVMSAFVVAWLTARLRLAGPVWLAALGATFAEQSDVLNIGIEGAILLGALTSLLVSFYTGMIWVSLLAGVRARVAANLILAWMYVTVRASQVVAGLVFNLLAVGVASAVYRKALGNAAVPESIGMFQPLHLPFLSHLTVIGPELFGQTILFYLTIALAFAAHFVLFRTNFGLALRASGENPAAANSAGISVYRMR